MPTHDFFFSLEVSSQGAPVALLGELVAHVLAHVGIPDAGLPELSNALQLAVTAGSIGGARRCDVQFRAHRGTLEIVVSANGGRLWQTSLEIPSSSD